MVVEPGQKPRVRSYARDRHDADREVMPTGDFDTDAALLRELLVQEVRSLLVADVDVATMNSGGLDSSIVTAIAARYHPGIHSFHIRYRGDWPADESVYARQLAMAAKTRHHEVVADPADFPDLVGDVAWSVGANADPIALSSKVLFRAVRRAGFKAILTGDGSDELFGGYSRLADALGDHSEAWAAHYVEALAAVPRVLRERLYTDEFRDHLSGTGGLACDQLEQRVRGLVRRHDGDRLAGLLAFEQADRLPAYHLARVDTTSMAHGVEARVPFLQGRVVRFARRLGSWQKINGEGVKRVLYRAAAGLVPASILGRPKQPFTLPVAAMLRRGQPLYDFAREVLDPVVVRRRGFFKPQVVEGLLRRHGNQPENATGLAVWSLLMLESFATAHGLR
jgi:asparagine synthase (glutamine-hydrolysing)